MSFLHTLLPLNLAEEKKKFLENQKQNPQFVYEHTPTEKELHQYGFPKEPFLSLAKELVERAYFGRNYLDLQMMEGRVVPQEDVTQKFLTFMDMHGLSNRFRIEWSASFVSRASIDADTLKLRTGAEFRERDLLGLMYHELGTHAIRRVNYEQQPWFKQKRAFGLTHQYLPTEEGMAALHSLLPKNFLLLHVTALRYLATHFAQTHSFAELWDFLGAYISDIDTRWMVCFRQKKGLENTQAAGGFTKDIVYFEGAVAVWQWLKNHAFNPTDLYLGKISVEDVERARNLSPNFVPLLPSFYTLSQDFYAQKMENIGKNNFLDQM